LNADLPDDIRVFAKKRVTKGFNSKTTCDGRSYSYTLPTYAFTTDEEEYQETSFRLSSDQFERLNSTLKLYVGTKNYHNFTIRKEAFDPSAKRFIMEFFADPPFVPDNTEVEFIRLKVKGQSFMMHQIRKMGV
jgi:tRNA pseudouridine38-40 synthase